MLNLRELKRLQPLIKEQGIDGWLLFDFRGSNPVASAVLGPGTAGARRVYVLVPKTGAPTALVHAIDQELWRSWPKPWPKRVWVTREEFAQNLETLVRGKTLAVEYSPNNKIPYVDTIPAGVVDLLRSSGAKLVSSVELVTRYCSAWTRQHYESHRHAAEQIAGIALAAIRLAGDRSRSGRPMTEFELSQWIRKAFVESRLETEGTPSVSFAANAARNHYVPTKEMSASIVPGKLLLVDLWAKEPGGLYADQTWMASIGAPSKRDCLVWETVLKARDAALDLIRSRFRENKPVSGAEADAAARNVISKAGFGGQIQSRTGHSIDRYGLHGFGPTIDDIETYDARLLIPGVGFSIEPGIYIPKEIGVRSEVNVHIGKKFVTVTPKDYQKELVVV